MAIRTDSPGRVDWLTTRVVDERHVAPGTGSYTFTVEGFDPNFCSLRFLDTRNRVDPELLSYEVTNTGPQAYDVEIFYTVLDKAGRDIRAVVALLYVDALQTTVR